LDILDRYDPETDVPRYGLGSIEFPTTVYDRGSLAFSNVLRGDLDAASRSILSPQDLSPAEAQTLTNKLLGDNPNPLLKTLVDVATNPLVVAGLLAGVVFWPLGTTAPLTMLAKGLGPKAKHIGRLMRYPSGAMSYMKGVGKTVGKEWVGLWEKYSAVLKQQSDWLSKYNQGLDKIYKANIAKYGTKLTPDDVRVAGMIADTERGGVNLVGRAFDVTKAGPRNPEMYNYFKGLGLKKGDSFTKVFKNHPKYKQLKELADNVRRLQDKQWSYLPKDKKTLLQLRQRAGAKGEVSLFQPGYGLPHYATMDRYTHRSLFQRMNKKNFSAWATEAKEKMAKVFYQDKAQSIIDPDALLAAERGGWLPAGAAKAVRADYARASAEATQQVAKIWERAITKGGNKEQVVKKFIDDTITWFKGSGKTTSLGARLSSGITPETAKATADKLRIANKKLMGDMLGEMGNQLYKAGNPVALQNELEAIGRVIGSPARYDTHLLKAAQRYTHNISQAVPWYHKNVALRSGEGLDDFVREVVLDPPAWAEKPPAFLKNLMEETLIPQLKGYKTWQQGQRSLTIFETNRKSYDFVTKNPMMKGIAPEGSALGDWLRATFGGGPKSLTAEGVEHGISSWIYTSALGANVSPISKNSLQTLATVINMPGMGPSSIVRGIKELNPRLWGGMAHMWDDAAGKMVKVKVDGVLPNWIKGIKEAKHPITGEIVSNMQANFPEFVAHFGEGEGMVAAIEAGDMGMDMMGASSLAKSGLKKMQEKLLYGFEKSEMFNRLLGFYAGQQQHLHHLKGSIGKGMSAAKKIEQANTVGANVVHAGHFTGGPLGTPSATLNWSAPLRQFTHFPLRMVDFLGASTRWGLDPSKLNFGTIGRTAATAGITYEVGKNLLGVDLSQAIGSGTIPAPAYEGAPFYPFPLVSPLVSAVGSAAAALYEGDMEKLGATAALAVPGGLAGRRLYKTLAPKYADYQNRTPDGRIPVYNDDHALIGTYTPMQMVMRAMGIKVMNQSEEQGAMKWLLSQRDKLREYRREYLQALFKNDYSRAEAIQKEYQEQYPELGPLQVKKTDITALKNRRNVSRINRVLKGFPKEARPVFQQVLGDAALRTMYQDVETNPASFDIYFPQ